MKFPASALPKPVDGKPRPAVWGLNHVQVTFQHNGRMERPTIMSGEVIKEVPA